MFVVFYYKPPDKQPSQKWPWIFPPASPILAGGFRRFRRDARGVRRCDNRGVRAMHGSIARIRSKGGETFSPFEDDVEVVGDVIGE